MSLEGPAFTPGQEKRTPAPHSGGIFDGRRRHYAACHLTTAYGFYPDRIAKESVPATVVLCDGFRIRCISGSRATATPKSVIIRPACYTPPWWWASDGRSSVKNLLSAVSVRRIHTCRPW